MSEFELEVGTVREAIAGAPPDATLTQMGRLIFRLGHFENFLGIIVRNWMPAEQQPTVQAMAKRPISQKIDLGRRHADAFTDEGLRARWLEVMTIAERAYSVRHDVMHGAWQIDPVERRQVAINLGNPAGEERLVVDVDQAAADADAALRGLLEVMMAKAGIDIPVDMIPFFSKTPPWAKGAP